MKFDLFEATKLVSFSTRAVIFWAFMLATPSFVMGNVTSVTGEIQMDIQDDGTPEMRLSSSGLGIGPATPSANLQVQGNTLITKNLTVGSSSLGSSNLTINGSVGYSVQTLGDNATLGSYGFVMADSSSGNMTLTLPYAGNVTGRIYTVKKLSSSYEVTLSGGDNIIDSSRSLILTSGNMPFVKVLSGGSQWHVLGQSSAGVATVETAQITYEGFQGNVELTTNDAASGWRNSTPAKPLDLDGDNILGSDGYWAFNSAISARPSYLSSWSLTQNLNNWNSAWGVADDPADPGGSDTLPFGRWANSIDNEIFEFEITGKELDGKVLTVGILFGFASTTGQTFELRQEAGGSETALSPGLDSDGLGADVAYFNITGALDGDKFVLITDANIQGITFDTSDVP